MAKIKRKVTRSERERKGSKPPLVSKYAAKMGRGVAQGAFGEALAKAKEAQGHG